MIMDLVKIEKAVRTTIFKDSNHIKGIEHKYSSDFIQEIQNEDHKKIFSPVSRRIRRKLSRESRSTVEVRRLSSIKRKENENKITRSIFNTGTHLPWIDSTLRSHINSSFPKSLRRSFPTVTREEIAFEDRKACKEYLSPSRRIRNCWLTCFITTTSHVLNELRLIKMHKRDRSDLLSIAEAVELTAKNTNSGLPLMLKKNDPRNVKWVKEALRSLFENPTNGSMINLFTKSLTIDGKGLQQKFFDLPNLLFHRFQISKGKAKIRQVWCVPHFIVALEAIFFGRKLEECKHYSTTLVDYPYSIGQTNRMISDSLSRFKSQYKPNSNRYFTSLDYSKYDRTIPDWYIDIFYELMGDDLDLSQNSREIYNMLRIYTKYSPFIFEGTMNFKKRGISSGLFITNLIDSIFNLTLLRMTEYFYYEFPSIFDEIVDSNENILQKYRDMRNFTYISQNKYSCILVLGDDGIVYWDEYMIKFLEKICSFIGMSLSVKHKCINPNKEDVFYLGRFWDPENIPDQTFEYMSDHIVFRTKFYKEDDLEFDLKDLNVMRILSICLPLKSGWEYLDKTFGDWPPLIEFLNSDKVFYLLKEWPDENYRRFNQVQIRRDPLDF
jgi:hypothetical protein